MLCEVELGGNTLYEGSDENFNKEAHYKPTERGAIKRSEHRGHNMHQNEDKRTSPGSTVQH